IFVYQVGDPFNHTVAELLERNFRNDDAVTIFFVLFDLRASSQYDAAATRVVTFANPAAPADDAAGGKIGAGNDLHQFVDRDIRFVDHFHQTVAHLAQIVRWNRSSHADCDPLGAVHQQVGKLGGEHGRLDIPLVVGRHKVDR